MAPTAALSASDGASRLSPARRSKAVISPYASAPSRSTTACFSGARASSPLDESPEVELAASCSVTAGMYDPIGSLYERVSVRPSPDLQAHVAAGSPVPDCGSAKPRRAEQRECRPSG